jgi:serine/threonine-protein kinase
MVMDLDSAGGDLCARGHRMAPAAERCHVCWGRSALQPDIVPPEIGGYQILHQLGRGAHGEVYKAREPGTGRLVALKVIRTGEPESDSEIKHHVRLVHPNIVPIFDGRGLHDDPPYFTMPLVEGGTLDDERWRDHFHEPARALQLVIAVADAIECAHQHLVLHRDLKPTNILIDSSGRPLVSDFSVAQELDGAESPLTRTVAGTPSYMSPEQAHIIDTAVTTASDVYALGAILYELLTRRQARPARTLQELEASFTADGPPPILVKGVSADLNAVCLRALSKDPSARYRSAALFAADLRCISRGEWLPWRTPRATQRFARWAKRNPWVAVSIVLGAMLLAVINALTFAGVREQGSELQQRVLKANAALAKAQAQAALAEVTKYADYAARTASAGTPLLEAHLQRPAKLKHNSEVELELPMAGFDCVFVIGCDGFIRARTPIGPPKYYETDFSFRDYFRGAMELAQRGSHDVYVSRAFRSKWDGRLKFAFATPVYGAGAGLEPCVPGTQAIGVFVAAKSASSTLGAVQIPELEGSGQSTALLGLRDPERPGPGLLAESTFHVIVHEKLRFGDERPIDARLATRLQQHFGSPAPAGRQFEPTSARPYRDGDYTDTLDESHDRWLGGFFPVGKTGLIVAVQTAYDTATRPVRRVENLLALNLGFFFYCATALWLSMRRRPQLSALPDGMPPR